MINSTNTVNIDGTGIPEADLKSFFSGNSNDSFTQWVVRPLALLSAAAVSVAIFLASTFLVLLALAFLPILAVSVWAMKTKLKRDNSNSAVIIETSDQANPEQTA